MSEKCTRLAGNTGPKNDAAETELPLNVKKSITVLGSVYKNCLWATGNQVSIYNQIDAQKYQNTRIPHSLYIYTPVIQLVTVMCEEKAAIMNVNDKTLNVSHNVSDE